MAAVVHEWPIILDALSRLAEAVAVIFAALYARKGVKLAGRIGAFLGIAQRPLWRRKRPGRWDEDPVLDRLRADADAALGHYLEAAAKVDHYSSKPAEGKHR